ncbi:TRIM65 [Blepharisma stoltei]|uniref:RanBP-type and C3HC4-type zinc finger-containing protein 1 n=1 Tax=Blepharisma stoltei TaxID=1481888 RepID=A0AAU9IXF3_9CILI|nr:unnamed protein product [Blepharisma stoltei]
MSEPSIFECSICLTPFNSSNRAPMSLPCGHVFCKLCISQYSCTFSACPNDQTPHPPLDKLPLCLNILHNLPKPLIKVTCCTAHPRRQIKYKCRVHNTCLCSECVLLHAGPGHELLLFKVNTEKLREDIKELADTTDSVAKDAEKALQEYVVMSKKLSSFYENQISRVNSAFEVAIRQIVSRQKELVEGLRKHLRDQQNALDMKKNKCSMSLEKAKGWSTKLHNLSKDLGDMTYDEFSKYISETYSELSTISPTKNQEDLKLYVFNDLINLGELGNLSIFKEMKEIKEMNWTCSRCTLENPESESYCNACLSARSSAAATTTATGATTLGGENDSWRCLTCNKWNPGNNKCCSTGCDKNQPDFAKSVGTGNQKHSPQDKFKLRVKNVNRPRGKARTHKRNSSF